MNMKKGENKIRGKIMRETQIRIEMNNMQCLYASMYDLRTFYCPVTNMRILPLDSSSRISRSLMVQQNLVICIIFGA